MDFDRYQNDCPVCETIIPDATDSVDWTGKCPQCQTRLCVHYDEYYDHETHDADWIYWLEVDTRPEKPLERPKPAKSTPTSEAKLNPIRFVVDEEDK